MILKDIESSESSSLESSIDQNTEPPEMIIFGEREVDIRRKKLEIICIVLDTERVLKRKDEQYIALKHLGNHQWWYMTVGLLN